MAKISRTALAPIWKAKVPIAEIAIVFGVSESWVSTLAKQYGLPSRAKGAVEPDTKPNEIRMRRDIPQREGWSEGMDEAVANTRGQYKAMAKLARKWGMSSTQVRARYFQVVQL